MKIPLACCVVVLALAAPAIAQENYESWPVLRSTFPSTGGGAAGTTAYRVFFKDGVFRGSP